MMLDSAAYIRFKSQLPREWQFVELQNEKFEFVSGLWTGKRPPYTTAFVLRNTNFNNDGTLDYSNVAELEVEERHLLRSELKYGDIIVEKSGGGPKQPVGRVVFFNNNVFGYSFSNFTCRIRVADKNSFEQKYLLYYLLALYEAGVLEGMQNRTTGIRNLDLASFKQIEIPLIPLAEQLSIAAVLSNIQEAIAVQQEIIDRTLELKKALMFKLFTRGLRGESTKETEIGPVPKSWGVVSFDKIALLQRGFDITVKEQRPGFIPVVSSSGINSFHDTAKVKGPGVIIGRKGSLGTAHYVETDYWPHDTTLWVKDFKGNHSKYLYYFLQTLDLKRLDTGTSNPTLNRNIVYQLTVVNPSIEEQKEIAFALSAVDEKIELALARKDVFTDLFKTMLHKLMTGNIRTTSLMEA